MAAKMRLRKYILLQQDTNAVRTLLRSNMWDPSVFPTEAFDELKEERGSNSFRTILNLNKNGTLYRKPNEFTKVNQRLYNPNYKGKSFDDRYQKSNHHNAQQLKDSRRDSVPKFHKKFNGPAQKSDSFKETVSEGTNNNQKSIKYGKGFQSNKNKRNFKK